MNKILPIVIVLLVLGAGGYYFYMKSYQAPAAPSMQATPTTTQDNIQVQESVTGASGMVEKTKDSTPAATAKTKEFKVDGNEFAFMPKTLEVGVGDTVKVTFTNTGKYPHNFMIKELDVKGKTIQPVVSNSLRLKSVRI